MIIPGPGLLLVLVLSFVLVIFNFFIVNFHFVIIGFYCILFILCILDFTTIVKKKQLYLERRHEKYLSIGVFNLIKIYIENKSTLLNTFTIRDNYPVDFLAEGDNCEVDLEGLSYGIVSYHIKPFKKGNYTFNKIYVRAKSKYGLIIRQYVFFLDTSAVVYPNLIELKKFLRLVSKDRQAQIGYKKRQPGGENEFDFLREYQRGDPYRKINWKATARRNFPVIEIDRREQNRNIIAVLDSGRMMTTMYGYLSKLDYAIDASLILAASAIQKKDHFGVLAFSHEIGAYLKPGNDSNILTTILPVLNRIKADFTKTDYRKAYAYLKHKIRKNSIFFIFSEIYNRIVSKDLISFLKLLAANHKVFLVSFEEIEEEAVGRNYRGIVRWSLQLRHTVEKEVIIKELAKNGVHTIRVNADTIKKAVVNSYLSV